MKYVAGVYGEYSAGSNELSFTIDDLVGVAAGDVMTLLVTTQVDNVLAALDGWTLLDTETDSIDFTTRLWTRIATEDDIELLDAGELKVELSTAIDDIAVGVLVVHRDQPSEPLVEGVTPFAVLGNASTEFDLPGTVKTTHAEDVVLAAYWVKDSGVAIDPLPAAVFQVAETQEVPGSLGFYFAVVLRDHALYMPLGDGIGNFSITIDSTADCCVAAVALRARPMPRPVGVSDPVPGAIGLELTGSTDADYTPGTYEVGS